MRNTHVVSAGGLVVHEGKVLLVQVNYGSNKGQWMLPGGMVEEGESLEDAAIREVKEETGVVAVPTKLIGVRSGVRRSGDTTEASLYFAFEMAYLSGDMEAQDANEIAGIKFVSPHAVATDINVIDLTKELIRTAFDSNEGLCRTDKELHTNTDYQSYDVYTIRE